MHSFVEPSASYSVTKQLLVVYAPSAIVLCRSAKLALRGLSDALASDPTEKVAAERSSFDDVKGVVALREAAEADSARELDNPATLKAYYLALASAGALLVHARSQLDLEVTPRSVRLSFEGPGSSGRWASIDWATSKALCILAPRGQVTARTKRDDCLLGVLNGCVTPGGTRQLKCALLLPLRDVGELNARLEAVSELITAAEMRAAITAAVRALPRSMDTLVGKFALCRRRVGGTSVASAAAAITATEPTARLGALIDAAVDLRDGLAALPALAAALATASPGGVLASLHPLLMSPSLAELTAAVESRLEPGGGATAVGAFAKRAARCYAIRGGANGLLDAARRTVDELTRAVHDHGERRRADVGPPSLRLQYAARKGFYFEIPGGAEAALPLRKQGYLQLEKKAKAWAATTPELHGLNLRLAAATSDCLVLAVATMEALVADIIPRLGALSAAVEAAAVADFLACGLAGAAVTAAANGRPYTRPLVTADGPLAIEAGRHPMLERRMRYVPNNTFLTDAASFCILTGANMAGKTTHLSQVALCVIMAQAGSWVPAEYMSFQPVDRVLVRMGGEDDISSSASTFLVECRDLATISRSATPRSLVLIDELGRATSTADGVAIAWACSEFLITLRAKTLFATHMKQLCDLAVLYPPVRCAYLETTAAAEPGDGVGPGLTYTHCLAEGLDATPHYGLTLAAAAGLPSTLIARARTVCTLLANRDAAQAAGGDNGTGEASRRAAVATRRASCYAVAQRLLCLRYAAADMGDGDLSTYVAALKQSAEAALLVDVSMSTARCAGDPSATTA